MLTHAHTQLAGAPVFQSITGPLGSGAGTLRAAQLASLHELGLSIAFGVALDTFLVRTLVVPSIAMLLGRWNWWPSALSRPSASGRAAALDDRAGVC